MKNNKYIQIPDKVIDLHGLTASESEAILNGLLRDSRGVHVRIIVGKGTRSANGPVLPNFVKNYLARHDISFRQSKIKEGGEGALEVFFD
jgi:DNA-nicking Smr family endonuclease